MARNTYTLDSIREPEAAAAVQKCSWWWAKCCPKHVEQRLNNKRFYNWVFIWLVILFEDMKMHGTTNHKFIYVYVCVFLQHLINVKHIFMKHYMRPCTGWTVQVSNPGGGEIFRTCPDRPWGLPSPLYNGYLVFTGGKQRPGRDADL
jgi:hypothetical protein